MLTTNQRPRSKGAFVGYVIPLTKHSTAHSDSKFYLFNWSYIKYVSCYLWNRGLRREAVFWVMFPRKRELPFPSMLSSNLSPLLCRNCEKGHISWDVCKTCCFARLPALSNWVRRPFQLVGRNWVRQCQDRYKWRAKEWSKARFPYQGGKRPT